MVTRKDIVDAIAAGCKTQKEIAERLGVSKSNVQERMRTMGLRVPKRNSIDLCLNCTMPREYCDTVCSGKERGRTKEEGK